MKQLLGSAAELTRSTPLPVVAFPVTRLPEAGCPGGSVTTTPADRLPRTRLRSTRLSVPPPMPIPMPKPPSACCGESAELLSATTLPAITAACCGASDSRSLELTVTPTRLFTTRLPTTVRFSEALVISMPTALRSTVFPRTRVSQGLHWPT